MLPLLRNIEADDYFENFFVFSVLSVLSIRLFLKLTGYPALGGATLHIAHLMWGGLFMLMAFLLYFFFINKTVFQLASMVAGIGFGTFIDELGKFITADNNYFYQPTFAIIYSIFVLLYLGFRYFFKRAVFTSEEYLANALDITKEALVHDFDSEERRQALQWLMAANRRDQFTVALTQLIKNQKPVRNRGSWWTEARPWITDQYRQLIKHHWIQTVGFAFFAIEVSGYVILSTLLVVYRHTIRGLLVEWHLGFYGWGLIISSVIALTLLSVGLFMILKISRRLAYRLFRYSLLTNVLLVTFFAFYFNELIAFMNLVANITFLKAFEYAQVQEKKLKRARLDVLP